MLNPISWLFGPLIDRVLLHRQRQLLLKQADFAALLRQIQDETQTGATRIDLGKKVEPPKIDATQSELEQSYGVGIWIYACINVIAEKMASIPFIVVDAKGEPQDSPLPERPNPLQSWNDFRQLLQIFMDTTGNAFVFLDRTNNQYWILRTSRVRIVPGPNRRSVIGYAYRPDSGFRLDSNITSESRHWSITQPDALWVSQKEFNAEITKWGNWLKHGVIHEAKSLTAREWIPIESENIIHFKYPNSHSDFYGLSPLQPLLISFISEMNARQWNRLFFENGAIPPGVLTFPEQVNSQEFKRLRDQFKDRHQGTKNAFMPFILKGNAKYQPFENSHTDLDFLNLLRWTRDDTLAVLNVPPAMVMAFAGDQGSTRSLGISTQREMFWSDTIKPKTVILDDGWNFGLSDLLKEGQRFTHDFTAVDELMPDWKELSEAAQKAIQSGMSPQEVRQNIFRLPPIPEDPIFLPAGLQPVNLTDVIPVNAGYPHVPIAHYPDQYLAQSHSRALSTSESSEESSDEDDEEEADRKATWQAVEKIFDEVEEDLFDWLKKLFRGQERRYIAAIKREFKREFSDEITEKAPAEVLNGVNQQGQEEWQRMVDAAFKEFPKHIKNGAEFGLVEAGLSAQLFDVQNPAVLRYIDQKVFAFAREVNQTTLDRLRETLREAIRNGESITQMTKRVQAVFDDTIRGTAARARMIARTESAGMVNGGTRLGYEQNEDLIDGVQWLSSRDNRVRPTHEDADGQVVNLMTGFFNVGGALLRFPGDPFGPAKEVIFCRCSMLAVLIDAEPV